MCVCVCNFFSVFVVDRGGGGGDGVVGGWWIIV